MVYITSPPDVLSRFASTFFEDDHDHEQEEEEGRRKRRRRRRERYAFVSMCGECMSIQKEPLSER